MQPKKYPVNLTIRTVVLVDPTEDGTFPSAFDVQDAVREALVDHLDHDILSDSISEGLEDKTEGARIDYSEVTLHEEQPGDGASEARYHEVHWNEEQAEGVRNALSMGELVSIANEDEGIIAYALHPYTDRVIDALNKDQPSVNETRTQLITRRRAELIEAVLARYPDADRLMVDVIKDPNNPGYHIADRWVAWKTREYQQIQAASYQFHDLPLGGPFDQELNDYIDDGRITQDFTLELKEQA